MTSPIPCDRNITRRMPRSPVKPIQIFVPLEVSGNFTLDAADRERVRRTTTNTDGYTDVSYGTSGYHVQVHPLDLASSCVRRLSRERYPIVDRTNDTPTLDGSPELEAGAIVYVLCGQTVV